jgi:hypothetical protein
MKYQHKLFLALDQLLNAIIGGYPDESLSARAFRWHRDGKRSYPYSIINAMFFWMKDHCRSAYHCEQELRHLPPEYRDREKHNA